MISFDTNLLLYALNKDCTEHARARAFFDTLPREHGAVAICELVLIELYVLLRNPSVIQRALSPADAVSLIQTFRHHPSWVLIDYPGNSTEIATRLWTHAAVSGVGRRIIFDARLALTLRYHGVTDFASRNREHFTAFGFQRVWNPIAD